MLQFWLSQCNLLKLIYFCCFHSLGFSMTLNDSSTSHNQNTWDTVVTRLDWWLFHGYSSFLLQYDNRKAFLCANKRSFIGCLNLYMYLHSTCKIYKSSKHLTKTKLNSAYLFMGFIIFYFPVFPMLTFQNLLSQNCKRDTSKFLVSRHNWGLVLPQDGLGSCWICSKRYRTQDILVYEQRVYISFISKCMTKLCNNQAYFQVTTRKRLG